MWISLLCLAFLPFGAYSSEGSVKTYVKELTDESFDSFIAANKYVLVKFYAPWCGHCKALAPAYDAASIELNKLGKDIVLAKVDSTVHSAVSAKYSIRGYPTLIFFKNGEQKPYGGGRDATSIVDWVVRKSGPALQVLEDEAAYSSLLAQTDVTVRAYFEDLNSEEAKVLAEVADSQDDIAFGVFTDKSIFKDLELQDKTVTLRRGIDLETITYDGEFIPSAIKDWIQANRLPLVTEFNQETAGVIFGGEIKSHHLLFLAKSHENYATLFREFSVAAEKFKGKLLFVTVDLDIEDNARILQFFGIKPEQTPTTRIVNLVDDIVKYKFNADVITAETLVAFTEKYVKGELSPDLKVEPLPENWDSESVKYLTAENFNEVAKDTSKNVFVKFYAPWCGHCKQLVPTWKKLADKYADVDGLVIAKLDATQNEFADVKIQGFPTLKLYKAGTNEEIDFNGDRTLEGLEKFLQEHNIISGSANAENPAKEEDEQHTEL